MTDRKEGKEFTVQGADPPVPVRGLSGRAGSPGPLACDRSALPVATQAGSGYTATGEKGSKGHRQGSNPKQVDFRFRERVNSLPDCGKEGVIAQVLGAIGKKRKERVSLSAVGDWGSNCSYTSLIWDDDEKKSVKKSKDVGALERGRRLSLTGTGRMRDRVLTLLHRVDAEMRTMRKVVKECKNTKVELKDGVERLSSLISQLTTREVSNALEGLDASHQVILIDDKEEKGSFREQGSPTKKPPVKTSTVATQTEREAWRSRNDGSTEKIRQRIESARNLEELEATLKEKWPERVFKAIREVEGYLPNGDVELNVAFWKGVGTRAESRTFKQMAVRFPDLSDMTEDEWMGEEVMTWVYESRRDTRDGPRNQRIRTVTTINTGETDADIYRCLKDWRDKLKELKVNRIAFPVPVQGWERIKKLMEFTLRDSDIVAMAYCQKTGRQRRNASTREASPKQGTTPARKAPKREEEVVIVRAGKPYAEALAQVKENINVGEIGIKIKHVRSTRSGEVLLTLANGGGECEVLKKEIQDKLGNQGYTARVGRRDDMVLQVRGLEATTSPEEVDKAIRDALDMEDCDIKMGTLRPAFGGSLNLTVTLSRKLGQRLVAKSPLQIGWATCKLTERIEVRRCLKCWMTGHLVRTCQSEVDRRNCCLRCGVEGHKVIDCPNQPFCPLCNRRGHRADSIACPEFRRAVEGKGEEGVRRRGSWGRRRSLREEEETPRRSPRDRSRETEEGSVRSAQSEDPFATINRLDAGIVLETVRLVTEEMTSSSGDITEVVADQGGKNLPSNG